MENQHEKWRIAIARELAQQLKDRDGMVSVVVAGSTARGWADEFSDLEIPIFWEELPDDKTRMSIAEALGGEFIFDYDGPSREDQLLIDGLQVDLWHITLEHQEKIIEAVLAGQRTDLSSLNTLDTIRSCVPLLGEKIIQVWKRQAEEYPDVLAKRVIQEHLPSFSTGELFLHAERGNPTAFFAQLSYLQGEIFLVLLALNRMYFPTFKWLYPTLDKMIQKPENIASRFRQAYQASYQQAIVNSQRILEETLALVSSRYPDLAGESIYRQLAYQRTPQFPRDISHLVENISQGA